MNLITIKDNGKFFYMTPDTSLNRDSNDYFCPEFVDEFTVVCFYYVRIEKNAKAVEEKFASRYISGFGYGIKLEAYNLRGEPNPFGEFMSSALDNTVYISPRISQEEFGSVKPTLKIDNTGIELCNGNAIEEIMSNYQKVIANITSISTLRSGDIILFEQNYYNTKRVCIAKKPGLLDDSTKISFGDIGITLNW